MGGKGRKKHEQLTLDQARKAEGRGGWRPNAGRPKGRTKVAHESREQLAPSYPQHVTLRVASNVPSLRRDPLAKTIRAAIAASHRDEFRVVHFNIEHNHLHLVTEASSKASLSRGLQGLKVRIARQVNKLLGRHGELFADRYHSRALKSPREVRNAIRYVLNNARHHAAERGETIHADWIDPCSSAIWFDGWESSLERNRFWNRALLLEPIPVARPRTWLLGIGWRRHGLLRFDDVPGLKTKR